MKTTRSGVTGAVAVLAGGGVLALACGSTNEADSTARSAVTGGDAGASAPVASCGVTLDAKLDFHPHTTRVDGTASLSAPLPFSIPSTIAVVSGATPNMQAELDFSSSGGPSVKCSYGLHQGDTSLQFSSCTDGSSSGASASADSFTLHIQGAAQGSKSTGPVEIAVTLNAADGTTCDDHDACTQTDTCQAGVCTGSNPVVCTALDSCHVAGTCSSSTGACSNPNAADGTTCGGLGSCTSGTCVEHTLSGATPLPDPPTEEGCYLGTLNGWLQIACVTDPSTIIPGFTHFNLGNDGVQTTASPALPFVYGQLQTTVIATQSETNIPSGGGTGTANQWGVQNNTNQFPCNTSDSCGVQFAVANDGSTGNGLVCISNGDATTGVYKTFCVGMNGTNVMSTNGFAFVPNTRKGALRAFDFANIAGYAFTQGGKALVAMVTQFSWVTSQDETPTAETDLPHRIPGLYSVVAPDSLGLAGKWTSVSGNLIGEANSSTAQFVNTEVMNHIVASTCPGDTTVGGPTCPGQPSLTLSAANTAFDPVGSGTEETNNLTLVQPAVLSFPNVNMVTSDQLGSTNTTPSCLSTQPNHLYIKDNEGDNGGTPSNVGGVTFWESPDIFVVAHGAPAPSVTDVAPDIELASNQPYDVYLRVHNEYGCQGVNGPINVFIDGADPNMGFASWSPVTAGAGSGQYTTYGSGQIVAPFGAAIIGPFQWTPPGVGHKCLLAAIAAGSETKPAASGTAPVLPPAYSSNQIAQRNLQIGSNCSYKISNTRTTPADLLLGVSVSPGTPAPGSSTGPTISLDFTDPTSAFYNQWNGQTGITVTHSGTDTTVVLDTSHIALGTVTLAGGASPTATITINQPSTASVSISALLTDPMTGDVIQQNGGTCTGSGTVLQ